MRSFRLVKTTYSGLLFLLAASIQLTGVSHGLAQEARERPAVKLIVPKEFVMGFPALVSISVAEFPQKTYGLMLPPLAQTLGQSIAGGVGIEVYMTRVDGQGGYAVGSTSYETSFSRKHPKSHSTADGGRWVRLRPGDAYFTTLDVYQLPYYLRGDHPPGQVIHIREGNWRIRSRLHGGGLEATDWENIRVRGATEQEEEVSTALRTDGLGQSWFPDVILSDESIPQCDHLPLETRRIVRLIGVLRAARRSCSEGLDLLQTYEGTENWGYLEGLIDYIEFECAIELGESGWAAAKRNDILRGAETTANIQEIENGRGLISHFRRLQAQRIPAENGARD